MARSLKTRVYVKCIQLLYRFPGALDFLYSVLRFVGIHAPLISTKLKWKIISREKLNFEISRFLFQQGNASSSHRQIGIHFSAGQQHPESGLDPRPAGYFSLNVSSKGLVLEGTVDLPKSRTLSLLLDKSVLRKVTLGSQNEFRIPIKNSVLQLFPKESEISILLDDNKYLAYGEAFSAFLEVPYGNDMVTSALKDGRFLSKKGSLTISASDIEKQQTRMLHLYEDVAKTFEKDLHTPLFLMYGTLLGFVRNGGFIPNDDDFDAGFVLSCKTVQEVKTETLEVMLKLLCNGFNVSINNAGRMFSVGRDSQVRLDVMPVWFEGPWLVAYGGACLQSGLHDFLPVQNGTMLGVDVSIPHEAEVFLSGYYGENWQIPDSGYVTDYRQTGKNMRRKYEQFMLSPKEFFVFRNEVDELRKKFPDIGKLVASGLIDKT